jgi:ABC-2 type transport system permease protein
MPATIKMSSETRYQRRGARYHICSWFSVAAATVRKEFIILRRYPLELVASFAHVFLIFAVFTLAGLGFVKSGQNADKSMLIIGIMSYGFVVFIFFTESLWTLGYSVRREQKQGTLEQLYVSPASRSATLVARAVVVSGWTSVLMLLTLGLMAALAGMPPFYNLALAAVILFFSVAGILGVGFAFAGLTLHIGETTQILATIIQFTFMVLCAPFFPFTVLPDWLLAISRFIPLSIAWTCFAQRSWDFRQGTRNWHRWRLRSR